MANTTFIELTVRPQDVDEFEFEQDRDEEGEPLLVHLSQGDIHPSELNEKSHLPFIGWHGSHGGDYRACVVVCDGLGDIETHYSDDAGFLATTYGPGDMNTLRANPDGDRKTIMHRLKRELERDDFLQRMQQVLEHLRDTSSRKK